MQGRGGLGIKVAKLVEDRGDLVGALIVQEDDEVLVVMSGGKIVRSNVSEVPAKGRDTMGVIFAKPDKNDKIIEVARNSERGLEEDDESTDSEAPESPESPILGDLEGDQQIDEVPLTSQDGTTGGTD